MKTEEHPEKIHQSQETESIERQEVPAQPAEQPTPGIPFYLGLFFAALLGLAALFLISTFFIKGGEFGDGRSTEAGTRQPLNKSIPKDQSPAVGKPNPVSEAKEKGIGAPTYTLRSRNTDYRRFDLNLQDHDLMFFLRKGKTTGARYGSFSRLDQQLREQGRELVFATNAGIFNKDFTPTGLFIIGGEEISIINLEKGDGNFFLKPNGVFFIKKGLGIGVMESTAFDKAGIRADFATQSGPLLLRNGKVHPAFNEGSSNKFIRSGVGILPSGDAVFLLSGTPVNFYDFSQAFLELGCLDALYLDGAISQMFIRGITRPQEEGDFRGL